MDQELELLSHRHLPTPSLVTSFFLFPVAHYPPVTLCAQEVQAPIAPPQKGLYLYSYGKLPTQNVLARRQHMCVYPLPARGPCRTGAKVWLETFLNMSLAMRVRFPDLLGPGDPARILQAV